MNDFITADNKKEFDYVTFARQFDSYRWWKPVFTIILFVIFYIIFAVVLVSAAMVGDFMWTGGDLQGFLARFQGGYDNLEIYDVTGVVVNLGSVIVMIPALILARAVVHERSFSSYSSSRGGWSHTVFLKSFIVAALVCGAPILIQAFYFSGDITIDKKFSDIALYMAIVCIPLQCLAEEYVFRALLNQTLGAWVRVPIIAIILSSVGFAALHPYNRTGQIAIFVSGIAMGLSAWIGRGIEVSTAIHVANNMTAFMLDGFGISKIGTDVSVEELITDVVINAAYVGVILLLRYKTDWFDRIKYYDAVEWNEDRAAKKAKKESLKAQKKAAREAKREAKQKA